MFQFDKDIHYKVGLKTLELEELMKRSIGRDDILMYVSSYALLSDNTIIFHTNFAIPDMKNSLFGGLYIPSIIWDCDSKEIKEFEPQEEGMWRDPFTYQMNKLRNDTRKVLQYGEILIYPPIVR